MSTLEMMNFELSAFWNFQSYLDGHTCPAIKLSLFENLNLLFNFFRANTNFEGHLSSCSMLEDFVLMKGNSTIMQYNKFNNTIISTVSIRKNIP